MKDLIEITEENGVKAVSARELYTFLEVKENLTDWNKRMLSYGFDEGIDYEAVSVFLRHENGMGGTTKKDYALTIDTAKEISMLQRSDKGKQARKYFIETEKKFRNAIPEISRKQLALMVIEQEEKIENLQLENDRMKPRDEFVNIVFNSDELLGIGEVAKLLGLPYGRNTLFSVLKEKGIFLKHKNEPLQKYVNSGYFEVKEKLHQISSSKSVLTVQTFATQKGLGFIAKTLKLVTTSNRALLN
jgi:anti-repressor protein